MAKLLLTEERWRIIADATGEWLKVGLSTDPADFAAAEEAVAKLYARIGKKRPYFVRLSSPMAAELYINLLTRTRPEMGDQLLGQLWDQLGDQLLGQLWDQLGDQLLGQLGDQLLGQLRGQLRGQLWDQLGDQLGDQLLGQLGDQQIKYIGTWFWGAWDSYLWGFYDGGRRVGAIYPDDLDTALSAHCTISRSTGWFYPFNDFCILTDRPEVISRDPNNRLHSDDGPALKYRDGYALYAVHGVRVPHWIIDAPETITTGKIDAEQNAEVRRVMTDRYRRGEDVSGVAAFLRDGGAELLDHDDRFGRLLRREVPGDEPIVLVHVLNPTPEPEGPLSEAQARDVFGDDAVDEALGNWSISPLYREGIEPRFKQYFLRVAPDLRPLPQGHWPQEKKREFLARQKAQKMTAKNAVASTWGKRGEDFNPVWRA